jgi:ABC-type glycerol-3-phosphate transport system substrate-binding protein
VSKPAAHSDVVNVYQVGKLWDYDVDGDPMVALSAGDLMGIMNGSWFATEIESGAPDMAGQWSIAAIPWGEPGREYDASTGGACLSIPTNAAEPDLAWEFIKYSMTPENQVEYFKIVSGVPSLKTSWTDPAFDEVNPYFGTARSGGGGLVSAAAPMQLLNGSSDYRWAITKVTNWTSTPQEALTKPSTLPPLE